MKTILLDTDVLMDFFLDRRPFSDDSAVLISMCEEKKVTGFITPVIYSNLYYLLRRLSSHQTVVSNLRKLFSFTQVLVIDSQAVSAALNSDDMTDFEDALQNYAAEAGGNIDFIITGNIKDFKKSKVAVMTPTEFLRLWESKI